MIVRVVLVICLFLTLSCSNDVYYCCDTKESSIDSVFVTFYPLECDGTNIESGLIELYEDSNFDELVMRIFFDSTTAVLDSELQMYRTYPTFVPEGEFWVRSYSEQTKKEGIDFEEMYGFIKLKACSEEEREIDRNL